MSIKKTLLEMVQDILSSMDGEEVNSISDTVESTQVATIIKNVFYDLASTVEFCEHYTLFELESSGDTTKPVLMTLPSEVTNLEWLKYNKRESGDTEDSFETLSYLPLSDFLDYVLDFTGTSLVSYTKVIGDDTLELKCYNDVHPKYYTTFDDNTVVFDSYLATVDTTLQKSKTMAWGSTVPVFTMDDDFVPQLDPKQFTILFNESKAMAWAEMKQAQHAKAERNVRRGMITAQRSKRAIPGNSYSELNKLPNYGRK